MSYKNIPIFEYLRDMYDRVSDVVENGVSFWSDFQSGSRVLKKVL